MPAVVVRILHPEPPQGAGELTHLLSRARTLVANRLAEGFAIAGADDVRVDRGHPDERSFGERVRALARELDPGTGLVVLGSGSIPLATVTDLARLVESAATGQRRAVTNNRFSSDVVAIGDAAALASVPDLASDNALPRWLAARGIAIDELPDRARLGLDLDSPIDLEIMRRHTDCPPDLRELAASVSSLLAPAAQALDALAAIARDPTRELLVAGRLSAATLRALEVGTACRIRALVEERGLRTAVRGQRPPASALGLLLDGDGPGDASVGGPGALGSIVGRLADGALIDTRVLLAHRLGADERAWPAPEDRYASDLLLADRVVDPWLQALTQRATASGVPIALGGHTLLGPGLAVALGIAP